MNDPLIASDPAVMMGKPVVAGTRITVELILEKMANGESIEQILDVHPRLTRQSVLAAIEYANRVLRSENLRNEHDSPRNGPKQAMSDRQVYNLVSDTVAGPNVRLKDNLYQGLAILICLLLGAGIGCLALSDRLMGVLLGGFLGLLVGLFGSGTFLMILRAVKHARGHHD